MENQNFETVIEIDYIHLDQHRIVKGVRTNKDSRQFRIERCQTRRQAHPSFLQPAKKGSYTRSIRIIDGTQISHLRFAGGIILFANTTHTHTQNKNYNGW